MKLIVLGLAVISFAVLLSLAFVKTESVSKKTDRKFSNSLGFAFMYAEESERRAILNNADEVIEPNSTWLISPDFTARKLSGSLEEIRLFGHIAATHYYPTTLTFRFVDFVKEME
jgi:hypothetical protein